MKGIKQIMMKKPKYFKLEELLTSSTARQKSIENIPSWDIVLCLNELALFLDDIRVAWKSGISVNSGFRNPKLNAAVKGVPNSVHQIGYAADIVPSNGKIDEFVAFLKKYLADKKFDQCIIESKGNTRWIHIALYSNTGLQRKRIFNMIVK